MKKRKRDKYKERKKERVSEAMTGAAASPTW